jgi:hypothetical protein
MAAPNLSMSSSNVTAPAGTYLRHRVTIRAGELVVRDRRSAVVLTAAATSWTRARNGTVTIETDAGTVTAARAGCGCGGK